MLKLTPSGNYNVKIKLTDDAKNDPKSSDYTINIVVKTVENSPPFLQDMEPEMTFTFE